MAADSQLILGGTGFIGRHVALMLARSGHHVVLAGRKEANYQFPADVRERISWVYCDLVTVDWAALITNVGVIYHFAWSTVPATANAEPKGDLSINVVSTIGLLEAMRRHPNPPRLVFASSGGTVYGKLRCVPVPENHPLAPITAYGAAKAAVELYLGYYSTIHGLDCRIVRLANPFGAGQDFTRGQGAVTTFLHLALTGQSITIWGDGEVVRDYIHISDAVAGILAVALAPNLKQPSIFNIASGRGVSLNEILADLEIRLGRELAVRREYGRPFDVPISVLDVTHAKAELGWSPRLSLSDGIAFTLADLHREADFSSLQVDHDIR